MQNNSILIFGFPVSLWIVAPAFYLAWMAVGLSIKKVLFGWLRRLTAATETKIDDIIIGAANIPVTLMVFIWGVAALFHLVLPPETGHWAHMVLIGSKIASILALVLFVDLLIINVLKTYSENYEILRHSQPIAGVLVHVLVFGLGGLMLLDSLGISITPIIASLGIGSLAVALALQPTFENFFSGFQLLVDQPIKPGHFIRLESGEEGSVEQIGWRTTWIRQGVNNMVIIPNKQLVNARVLNYNYPSPELVFTVAMGVHYASDLAKVEKLTVEVATQVLQKTPGALPDAVPVVRYTRFGASSIDFNVVLKAKSFPDVGLVTHEFIKAITVRFGAEKIVMPYPIVAVDTGQQSARFTAN